MNSDRPEDDAPEDAPKPETPAGKPIAKKQHYVPQLLLRRFTPNPDSKQPKTCVYDLARGTKYNALIKNVAHSIGFYNAPNGGEVETLETWLGANVETPAGAALARLIESQSVLELSSDDRLAIAKFVATLAVRGRVEREEIEAFPSQLLEFLEARGETLAPGLKQQLQSAGDGPAIHNSIIQEIAKLGPALAQMGWRLARPPQGREFCSSDSPVVRFNPIDSGPYGNLGLLCRGIQLQLAVAPEWLLLIADPTVYGTSSGGIDLMTEDHLLHYNSLLAGSARQFLFSRSGDFDVREGMYRAGARRRAVWPE
jgi:Protein of unknown function (DUF4238)